MLTRALHPTQAHCRKKTTAGSGGYPPETNENLVFRAGLEHRGLRIGRVAANGYLLADRIMGGEPVNRFIL
jgi:hypothetical protein